MNVAKSRPRGRPARTAATALASFLLLSDAQAFSSARTATRGMASGVGVGSGIEPRRGYCRSVGGARRPRPPPPAAPRRRRTTTATSAATARRATSDGASGDGVGGGVGPREALARAGGVLQATASKFASGWVAGGLLACVWRVLSFGRGGNDPLAWAIDWGTLAAIFTAPDEAARAMLEPPPSGTGSSSGGGEEAGERRAIAVRLWSVVARNAALAAYFRRSAAPREIIRSAVVYAGLTYFFVGRKLRRDGVGPTMGGPMGGMGGMNGFATNGFTMNGMNGTANGFATGAGGQQASMLRILQQIQQQQQEAAAAAASGKERPRPPQGSGGSGGTSTPSKPTDFVDVEWTIDDADESGKGFGKGNDKKE